MTTRSEMRGLVDFALIEFADDRRTGRAAEELLDLHDRGIIEIHSMVVVGKHHNGVVHAADLGDALHDRVRGFAGSDGARADLLGDEDLREAAAAMQAGHFAMLVLYRITWALPFDTVANDSQGELLASGRVPAADLLAALGASTSGNQRD